MAREQVSIDYKSGHHKFHVVLTSHVTDFFARAKGLPEIASKEGEDLVAALLKHAKGAISKVERHKDGKRNNGPHGEPAIEEFNDKGLAVAASLYENGQRNDGKDGAPAYRRLNDKGAVIHVAHYRHGQRNDGVNGEPSEQISDENGLFVYIARYKDDKQAKVFTQEELREYQAQVRPESLPRPAAKKKAAAGKNRAQEM